MKDISKITQQPISQLRESLKYVKTSFEKVSAMSEETFSKWKIGKRNFP